MLVPRDELHKIAVSSSSVLHRLIGFVAGSLIDSFRQAIIRFRLSSGEGSSCYRLASPRKKLGQTESDFGWVSTGSDFG